MGASIAAGTAGAELMGISKKGNKMREKKVGGIDRGLGLWRRTGGVLG